MITLQLKEKILQLKENIDNIIESVETAVSLPWSARYEFEEDFSPSSVVINSIRSQITNFF